MRIPAYIMRAALILDPGDIVFVDTDPYYPEKSPAELRRVLIDPVNGKHEYEYHDTVPGASSPFFWLVMPDHTPLCLGRTTDDVVDKLNQDASLHCLHFHRSTAGCVSLLITLSAVLPSGSAQRY